MIWRRGESLFGSIRGSQQSFDRYVKGVITVSSRSQYHVRHNKPVFGPRQANLVLIAYASSEGSGEPAHPRSLARTSAARSYKQ